MQGLELAALDALQILRCPVLDAALGFVSRICDHGEVWIVLAAALLASRRTRRQGAALALGLLADLVLCNLFLKPLIGRARPFAVNPAVTLAAPPPGDASFPSGHTASSFAAVTALRRAGSPLWRPALALAAVIAFSRLYLYVHWPSDVLGGMLAGALAGWAGARLSALWEERDKRDAEP